MELTSHRMTVRLHHTDATGLMFYGRLFELVQEAFEDGMEAGGVPIGELLRNGGFRLPVVHVEANYTAPVSVGDVVEIRLSFAAGDRSLRVYADIVDVTGRQVAAVTIVHAATSAATGQTITLPDALRALTR